MHVRLPYIDRLIPLHRGSLITERSFYDGGEMHIAQASATKVQSMCSIIASDDHSSYSHKQSLKTTTRV